MVVIRPAHGHGFCRHAAHARRLRGLAARLRGDQESRDEDDRNGQRR